ncbi:hypothetical protein AVEN_259236-1 [Araneus ventricosus]|uniref:Uncharacterized protein n=1 Tax=Araneus ventricosus TaxID=182803 RepID=A0A4Y2WQE0_ARAVE|nr:hypothetical protein AVEN_44502-1 [Araneus ventricosus]GBO39691.1 hypothetical protein AVEN_259236-1 [Araneus ventricosus]
MNITSKVRSMFLEKQMLRQSTTHPNEMKIEEAISEDSDGHMLNTHAPIQRASMAANILHSLGREIDYRRDVSRVTKGNHNHTGQLLRSQTKL